MVGMLAVLYIAAGSISRFLYIPILVILLSVFVVVGGKHSLKGVGVSILVFIVSLVMFNAYYNFTCGPNYFDVRVMKPMAEKISDYIVKNGIPKSLKDIPDLPYGLEGCKGEQNYYKFDNKEFAYIEVFLKEDAESNLRDEACHFANKGRFYTLKLDKNYVFGVGGDLRIEVESENSETGMQYFFK
jgi:hypothetical protein